MKILIAICLFSTSLFAQTSEETRLRQENAQLREKVKQLEAQASEGKLNDAKSQQLMETLKRGQKFQEEQNKALQELDEDL